MVRRVADLTEDEIDTLASESEIDRRKRVAREMRRDPGRIPDGATPADIANRQRVVLPPNATVRDFFDAAADMAGMKRDGR